MKFKVFTIIGIFSYLFTITSLFIPIEEWGYVGRLSNFQTRQDLEDFLFYDTTDRNQYTINFDCSDFAMQLQKNAYESGYRVRLYTLDSKAEQEKYNSSLKEIGYWVEYAPTGHLICKAYIIDENVWVLIEPQGDLILNKETRSKMKNFDITENIKPFIWE